MPELTPRLKERAAAVLLFLKWLLYACAVGLIVGGIASAFHYGIDWATELRFRFPWLILCLPLAGAAIVLLYRLCGMENDSGTNQVLIAVRDAQPLKLRTAPLIFLATILTHLTGGSAGREGAALQLGGSTAAYLGRTLGLDAKDRRVMVMCGMAAAFSALFGTPLTAALFAMEMVSVGVMYYAAIVPCTLSALLALQVARWAGLHKHGGYQVTGVPELDPLSLLRVCVLGLLCALLSILFCRVIHAAPKLYAKYLPNPVVRAMVGGLLVLALTALVGSQDYNGAGDGVIRRMLGGESIPEAFLLKLLFTALTLGAGFRGGEIVPVLFTGAAFGSLAGPLLGLSQSFGGALGMAAVFCGTTNCPLSSVFLAHELFGGQGLGLYAMCCSVSYMLSDYYSLYSAQKIVYSKFKTEWVNQKAK